MLKALLKKQLLELSSFYFTDGKTGKRRSKGGIIGFAFLYVFLFLACAAAFAGIAALFGEAFIPAGLSWLFFSMTGMISLFISSLVNMFMASSELYRAKDNELLLSMPVKPGAVLFVRMLGLYLSGLGFVLITFLPAVITYLVISNAPAKEALFPIAVLLLISLAVLALSSVFGYVVALISSRLKNKSFITVLITLILLAVYYVVYFRINTLLQSAVQNAGQISSAIRRYLFPFYHMGRAAEGSSRSLAVFAGIVLAVLLLVFVAMAKSFTRIAVSNGVGKKTAVRAAVSRQAGKNTALRRKELKRFAECPAYMLNIGLSLLILALLGIFLLFKMQTVQATLRQISLVFPDISRLKASALCTAACMTLSMGCFTAPSISLEGKNLWLLQALPVRPYEALKAKLDVHMILSSVPSVIFAVCSGIVLKTGVVQTLCVLLFELVYACLSAAAGLAVNLKHPNFTWKNETVPIKQSASVAIVLFGGWGVALLFAAGAFFLRSFLRPELYIFLFTLLLGGAARLLTLWLKTKGSEIFASL